LGFKLSLGLEMLLSRNLQPSAGDVTAAPAPQGPAWAAFLARLADNGYFQGELAGSARHRELTAQAVRYWQQQHEQEEEEGEEGVAMGPSRLDRLLGLVAKIQQDGLATDSVGSWLRPAPKQDDDESWLEVTPESLDRYRFFLVITQQVNAVFSFKDNFYFL
jgi:SGT1 protein